jgi:4-methyl-5(b-hydroxyethyl)-thiazole monophosphate biosynthesis
LIASKHVIVPVADGFEEIEAVVIVDILRRAGIRVTMAGVGGLEATGSHGITLRCDARIEDCDAGVADAVVLPGGMPGSKRLRESAPVMALLEEAARLGKLTAAICAAPTVLHAAGLLAGRRATSHPAHAAEMTGCHYLEEPVVVDGTVVTSRGAGTAVEFAAAIVSHLAGPDAAADILDAIQYRRA